MNKNKKQGSANSGGGIGFCGLLAIVFIVLKLTEVITWSWLWVLSPLWIPFVIAIPLVLIFAILASK
jgi:uncharacterized protein (DUF983 family)